MNLVIDYLKNYPEHVPLLATWIFDTWGHYYSSLEEAQADLKMHLKTASLPLTYIALIDDIPVGTCSLMINDGIRPDLVPWLGSLFVEPNMRGRGVGEQLIHAVTEKAHNLGYRRLYLLAFDETLPSWYAKLGWGMVGMDELNGYPVSVMELKL